jgi:ABC-type multidrug transport system fused ATPase/permease subunit
VEFLDVSVRYRPTTEIVFSNLNFSVQSGAKIGVVGRTGAGKSTLGLCISRILELCAGKIIIDGIDISKIDL